MNRYSTAILLLLLASPAAAQFPGTGYPGRYPGTGRGTQLPPAVPGGGRQSRNKGDTNKPDQAPLPSFNGKVRGSGKKALTIETEDGNTLEFHCSKKTHYYDGGKTIKASDVKEGDTVAVEAKKAPDNSLDAVVVRKQKAEAAKPPAS